MDNQDFMKILFVSINMPSLSLGKSDLYADIIYCLSNMRHDITILASSIEDNFQESEKKARLRL